MHELLTQLVNVNCKKKAEKMAKWDVLPTKYIPQKTMEYSSPPQLHLKLWHIYETYAPWDGNIAHIIIIIFVSYTITKYAVDGRLFVQIFDIVSSLHFRHFLPLFSLHRYQHRTLFVLNSAFQMRTMKFSQRTQTMTHFTWKCIHATTITIHDNHTVMEKFAE